MGPDGKVLKRADASGDKMAHAAVSKADAGSGERMLKIRPNPAVSADGYYETQMQRFPAMMAALGKY